MKVILIGIVVILLFSFIITLIVHKKQFGIRIDNVKERKLTKDIQVEKVKFHSGKNKLSGFFYYKKLNSKESKKIVVLVHGYGLTHKDYALEIEEFARSGFTVFAYDMTGCGESDGKNMKGFSQFIMDAESAVKFASQSNIFNKIIVLGHSTGGYAAAALLNIDNIKVDKVIAIAGFNATGKYVQRCVQKNLNIFSYLIEFWVYVIEYIKFGKISMYTGINGVNKFPGEVLVIQGKKDDEMYGKGSLYSMQHKRKRESSKFMLIPDADHYPLRIKKGKLIRINKTVFKDILEWINS